MRWEWDVEGDSRVSDLWHWKSELSESGKVVYSKWYNGRATFFSRQVYTALLTYFSARKAAEHLDRESREIFQILQMDSPLSTKQLREASGLKGKALSSTYDRALKQLWRKFLIVGYGEVDDGAFPSLAVGSSQHLFEDLWEASQEISNVEAEMQLRARLDGTLFWKKMEKELHAQKSL